MGIQRYRVGNAEIFRIQDMQLDNFTAQQLFPQWNPARLQRQAPELINLSMDEARDHVLMSIHTWVIREAGRVVLIDTGAGNDKERPYAPYFHLLQNPYLERLAAAGIRPEDVDHVLLTHLHVDHTGWNTRWVGGKWVPTFPNARYTFMRAEHDFFTDPAHYSERTRTSFMVQQDSVNPVIEAGLADRLDYREQSPVPGFTFVPTRGHSVAHSSIILESEGEKALFAGDVLHHPFQVSEPDLQSIFDQWGDEAVIARRWALGFAATHNALLFSSHFPHFSVGRVTPRGEAFEWAYVAGNIGA